MEHNVGVVVSAVTQPTLPYTNVRYVPQPNKKISCVNWQRLLCHFTGAFVGRVISSIRIITMPSHAKGISAHDSTSSDSLRQDDFVLSLFDINNALLDFTPSTSEKRSFMGDSLCTLALCS